MGFTVETAELPVIDGSDDGQSEGDESLDSDSMEDIRSP